MDLLLRVFLIVCAVLVLVFIIRRVRKSELRAVDTVFWFIFASCLALISIFPQIAYFFSRLLGIESPANFIFLLVIAVLVIREFVTTVETAKLREQVDSLTQEIALADHREITSPENPDNRAYTTSGKA